MSRDERIGRRAARSGEEGVRARRAAKRLLRGAEKGDPAARDAVAEIAGLPGHPFRDEAARAVAGWWYRTRDPVLRRIVLDAGPLPGDRPALLACAALTGRLPDVADARDAPLFRELIRDADGDVAETTARFCAAVDGQLLYRLWQVGLHDPPLRAALLTNPSEPPTAEHQVLWEEMLLAPDPDLGKALRRWRTSARQKEALGRAWARTDDPELRALVIRFGALALDEPERLRTLALGFRLDPFSTDLTSEDAARFPDLLTDAEPLVRESASFFCRSADEPALQTLWNVPADMDSPLRQALLQNPEPPRLHLGTVWSSWLERPAPDVWDALVRWGRPPASGPERALGVVALSSDPEVLREEPNRKAIIEALGLGDHPLAGIAEQRLLELGDRRLVDDLCEAATRDPTLLWVCDKHRLVPKDRVKRAVFFLLTGRFEEYRALDPRGALLSVAYAASGTAARERIREAIPAAGRLDIVRVIVGDDRRTRIGDVTDAEARYVAGRLADRGEWPRLWEFVQDVPLTTGTELIRRFDGWVPPDDDGRHLFGLYIETDPEEVAAAVRDLAENWPNAAHQATIRFRGRVNDVSFAPDAPLLAVAGTEKTAGLIDLTSARLVERHDGFGSSVGRILHVGGGAFVAGERTNRRDRRCRLLYCADGASTVLHTADGSVTSLALTGDDGSFAAATRSGDLITGPPGGAPVTATPLVALRMPKGDWARSLAAHRPSGRLAVLGRTLLVTSLDGEPPVRAEGNVVHRAAFAAPDLLACAEQLGTVHTLRLHSARMVREAETRVPGLGGLEALPGTGRLVVADRRQRLSFVDAATLKTAGTHAVATTGTATSVQVSPGGDFLAVGHDNGETHLFDLRSGRLPHIAAQPLAGAVPRDLGIVAGARAADGLAPGLRSTVELLHACLEHRFRSDPAIGDAVALRAGDYDIGL